MKISVLLSLELQRLECLATGTWRTRVEFRTPGNIRVATNKAEGVTAWDSTQAADRAVRFGQQGPGECALWLVGRWWGSGIQPGNEIFCVLILVTPHPASHAEWRPSPPATTTAKSSAARTMGTRVSGLVSSIQLGQLRLA